MRHVKEHDGTVHECPDCDYKNVDVRNLESHRIKHSNIEKYSCKLCEQKFKYNTQVRRHIRDKKCPKLSGSPEHLSCIKTVVKTDIRFITVQRRTFKLLSYIYCGNMCYHLVIYVEILNTGLRE